MKTLELDLKKKLFIIDVPDGSYLENFKNVLYMKHKNGDRDTIDGRFKFICKGSELTEEIANELVESWESVSNDGSLVFENYKNSIPKKRTAKESFISAIEANKMFWMFNPIPDLDIDDERHKEMFLRAKSRTFKNPLIFQII